MLDDIEFTDKLVKDNDYTLSQVRTGKGYEDGVNFNTRITRTFNFLAAQVTMQTRDITYQGGGYKTGGSSGVASTVTVQNFDDFQSKAEIRLMHEELVKLGGRPPAIDSLLEDEGKKPLRLPAPGGRKVVP